MRAEGGCSLCGANRKPRPSETPDSWWERGLGFPPHQASQPTGRKGPRTGEADPDLRLDSTPARVTDYPKLEILVIVLICAHRWKFSTLVLPTRLELILSSPPSNVCPDCLARTAAGGDSCAVHPRAPPPPPAGVATPAPRLRIPACVEHRAKYRFYGSPFCSQSQSDNCVTS